MTLAIALALLFFFVATENNLSALSLEKGTSLSEKSTQTLSRAFAHYIRGILYDNENKIDKAIEEYLAAKVLDETSPAIHKRLAMGYIRSGQYEKAEQELIAVKKLNLEDTIARTLLAHFYTAQKKFTEAASEYEELLKEDPADLELLASLADLYVIQEKMEEAVEIYQKILKEKPDSAQVHFNLGIILTKVDKLKEAEEHFRKALEIDPKYLQAELALALLNELNQDLGQAIKHYEQALEIDPLNINVYHRLAQTYYRDERVEDAINQYEFILKLNPYDIDAYLELAYIYLDEKRTDECIAILQEALTHKRNWRVTAESKLFIGDKIDQVQAIKEAQVHLLLGLAYVQNKEDEKAIEAYKNSIQAQPESGASYFYLGAIYERTGRREKAYEALKESVRLDGENPDALNYLGYMYADDGINLDQAQKLIEKALEISPDNGAYIDSLGWVYFKKGNIDQALAEIERASTLLEDAEVFEHLGDIYKAKGLLKKTEQAWERTLELDPERESVKEKLKKLKNPINVSR